MREITSKVYQFDELSESAKERARDWFREGNCEDTFWSENVIEDAATIAGLMGIDIRTRPVKLMGGGTRNEPCIYWEGFSHQGSGACFEGRWEYKKGCVKAVKEYAPKDAELHRIVEGLAAIQRKYFYQVTVEVSHRGHYQHSYCTEFENPSTMELSAEDFDEVKGLLRSLMDWIYRQLEKEWEYQNSDECVDENIKANEYEFTEEGRRA